MTIYILVNAALGWRTQPESSFFFFCVSRDQCCTVREWTLRCSVAIHGPVAPATLLLGRKRRLLQTARPPWLAAVTEWFLFLGSLSLLTSLLWTAVKLRLWQVIRNDVCTKQQYSEMCYSTCPGGSQSLVVGAVWKWVTYHKPVRCQGFAYPIGQKETWAKDEVYMGKTE